MPLIPQPRARAGNRAPRWPFALARPGPLPRPLAAFVPFAGVGGAEAVYDIARGVWLPTTPAGNQTLDPDRAINAFGLTIDANGDGVEALAPDHVKIGFPLTVVIGQRRVVTGIDPNAGIFAVRGSLFSYGFANSSSTGSGELTFSINSGGSFKNFAFNQPSALDAFEIWGCSVRSGDTRLFRDGVQVNSNADALFDPTYNADALIQMGDADRNTTRNPGRRIHFALVFDQWLTPAQHAYLADPRSRWDLYDAGARMFVPMGAGGGSITRTGSLEAVIRRQQEQIASMSAGLRAEKTLTGGVEAAIGATRLGTSGINAAVAATPSHLFALDTAVERTGLTASTLQAAVQRLRLADAGLDAHIGTEGVGLRQATLDAILAAQFAPGSRRGFRVPPGQRSTAIRDQRRLRI